MYAQFCQELPEANHWSTYAAYKRQLTTKAQNTPAANHLLETRAWFIAYMRYQHHYAYFDSRHDIARHLKQIKMSLHECLNFMIGFILPISVMMAVSFFVVKLFGPSPKQKSFSEALELCSNTVLGSKNSSHVTDFMENCGNVLLHVHVEAVETFLTGCIKKLTSEGKPKALANSILICTRKLQSEGGGSLLGILASVVVMAALMTRVLIYFRDNPPFPTHNLSFWDELKCFMHRLQGTCANTPLLLPANDLPTRCDDMITRLQGLDDPAAHEKSALLAHLWGEAKQELPDNADDQTIARSLQQERTIVCQGKLHHLSFLTTAAKRRCSNTFDLTPGDNTTHSFKTSSIKQLVAPPYVALFKPDTNIEENEPILTVDIKTVKLA